VCSTLPETDRGERMNKEKWTGKDARGKEFTLEKMEKMLDDGEQVWLDRPDNSSHGIFPKDAVPRPCPECGFPILQILNKFYTSYQYSLGCPWCDSWLQLCLICGKIAYTLPDSCNKHITKEIMKQARRKHTT